MSDVANGPLVNIQISQVVYTVSIVDLREIWETVYQIIFVIYYIEMNYVLIRIIDWKSIKYIDLTRNSGFQSALILISTHFEIKLFTFRSASKINVLLKII